MSILILQKELQVQINILYPTIITILAWQPDCQIAIIYCTLMNGLTFINTFNNNLINKSDTYYYCSLTHSNTYLITQHLSMEM